MARGHSVEWWSGQAAPSWFPRRIEHRSFPHLRGIGEAFAQEKDAAIIATWWESAFPVAANLRNGSRGYYLCQDIDEKTYSNSDAGSSYRLGLHCLTEGVWVTEEIQRRYGVQATNVGIGLDHEAYGQLPVPRDRNRIFCSHRPKSGPNDLKGWGTALAVVREVHRQNPQTTLVTFGADGAPQVEGIPHRHVRPTDQELRRLYAEAGCYLMTSRHEGFCLPACEAMQCFPEDTPVIAKGVLSIMRKSYSGQLVTIKTARGIIRVTPEHPFWTNRGWCLASDIGTSHLLAYNPEYHNSQEIRNACQGIEEVCAGNIGKIAASMEARSLFERSGCRSWDSSRSCALAAWPTGQNAEDSRSARRRNRRTRSRLERNRIGLSGWFGGRRRVRYHSEDARRKMETSDSDNEYINGFAGLAEEDCKRAFVLCIVAAQKAIRTSSTELHLSDRRNMLAASFQEPSSFSSHQATTHERPYRVVRTAFSNAHQPTSGFSPPLGHRDTAIEFEVVAEVGKQEVKNLDVFNFNTVPGTYAAHGYIVHNCGTPLVCTDANGNREFSLHGQTCLMGQSVEELAGHVLKLQRDHDEADALGEAGRRFVLRYQWPAVMDKLEAVLQS